MRHVLTKLAEPSWTAAALAYKKDCAILQEARRKPPPLTKQQGKGGKGAQQPEVPQ